MKATILVPAVATLLMCGLAFAGDRSAEMMKKVDSNADGKISLAEHDAHSKMMFQMMDSNKDGFVTAVEMEAGHKNMMGDKKMDHGKMKGHDKMMDGKKMDHDKTMDHDMKEKPATK